MPSEESLQTEHRASNISNTSYLYSSLNNHNKKKVPFIFNEAIKEWPKNLSSTEIEAGVPLK